MAKRTPPPTPKSPPRFDTCPGCGKSIRVERDRFVTHERHPLIRAVCPQSGKPSDG